MMRYVVAAGMQKQGPLKKLALAEAGPGVETPSTVQLPIKILLDKKMSPELFPKNKITEFLKKFCHYLNSV
jgi:hypothetical protein